MKKIVLFDIDGTLLLTGGAGIEAFDLAFRKLYGRPAEWGGVSAAGRTDLSLFRELGTNLLGYDIPDEELFKLLDTYSHFFEATIQNTPNFQIMEGTEAALEELSTRDNIALGLGTGNLEQTAWMKVARANLDHFFSFGGFGSDAEIRADLIKKGHQRGLQKTSQTTGELFVIGDTPLDIEAGKLAGGKVIAVASHSHSYEELESYKPDAVMESLAELDTLCEVIGTN